jgi:aryl-alcohol dehydrogenase-like predicted oxidoreductase
VPDELLHDVVDVLDEIAAETGRSVPQIALNWLTTRPTVSSVIIGARDLGQLEQNLGAVGWTLEPGQLARLDQVSRRPAPYPHFPYERQAGFALLDPPLGGLLERPVA